MPAGHTTGAELTYRREYLLRPTRRTSVELPNIHRRTEPENLGTKPGKQRRDLARPNNITAEPQTVCGLPQSASVLNETEGLRIELADACGD